MKMEDTLIYVNPAHGADTNTGAEDNALRTLGEAARRANQGTGSGAVTIVLAEGIYAIDKTVLLKPLHRSFSSTARLTIRAEVLPDDPEWHTGRMPTLVFTMPIPRTWNGKLDGLGGAADGIMVETSHVSIRGLKFLGIPVVESPQPGLVRRLYAISRLQRDLEDLEIGHCVFVGDELTTPLHVGIIAHGDSVDVHHCLFRGLKISVVYWSGGSRGHAMRHCVCDHLYGSGVWTCGIADDFVYHNNVVVHCNYAWTYQSGTSASADARSSAARGVEQPAAQQEENHYRVVNSLFGSNRRLSGSGTGARLEYKDVNPTFLELVGTMVTDEAVIIEDDQMKRSYLHPVGESEAAQIGAGLFEQAFV